MHVVDSRSRGELRLHPSASSSPSDLVPELVALFCGLPAMASKQARQTYLPPVGEELNVVIQVDHCDDIPRDVEAMLKACAEHWGGVWALVEALEYFTGDDLETTQLRERVARYVLEPVLIATDRPELRRLLNRLSSPGPAELRRMLRAVAPSVSPPATSFDGLFDVARELEEGVGHAGHDEVPCLLVFVDLVIQDLVVAPGRDSGPLRRWADRVAERLHVGEPTREAARDQARARLRAPASLVARLQPADGRERFWLSVDLHWGEIFDESLHRDEAPRPLADVPGVLHRILGGREDVAGLQLTIEVVLPVDRLGEPVDEWKIGEPGYQLGHTYPVVVRTANRHADGLARPGWNSKWQWVRRNGQAGQPDTVYWDPAVSGETLRTELLADTRRVCLVLPEPPDPNRPIAYDRLRYGLAAGVPIVFWCRDIRDRSDIERELVRRARANPVHHHRQLVFDLRRESNRSGAEPTHVGRHLTLLWDDYSRKPRTDLALVPP